MATKMHVSINYGTHMGALIETVNRTDGPILELGLGVFSTPYLHYVAELTGREVVSYENFPAWSKFFAPYKSDNHKIITIKEWDEADIERYWDVVLVDHTPGERRKEEIRRVAKHAKYVIVHDSNGRYEREYGYTEIYPLFKYKKVWDKDRNHATVLSNFVDLEDLWK